MMNLDSLEDLSSLLNAPAPVTGVPLLLKLSQIQEDPNQPRKIFDEEKLRELADSIKVRGVKTPISVHEDESNPGFYIINHGARRYRASMMAGKETIPAYIDGDYTFLDQLVENIQRDNLTPRETADGIALMLNSGMKKGEVAKRLGKSAAFVSQHVALLSLPEPVAAVFNAGKVSDVTVVNELNTLYGRYPEAVEELLQNEDDITRSTIRHFKEFLKGDPSVEKESEAVSAPEINAKKDKPTDPKKLKKVIVQVMYQGQLARLILNKRAHTTDEVWLQFEESGEQESVPCAEISSIVAVIEG